MAVVILESPFTSIEDSAKIYLDELLKKFRDTKYADDARIAQIIIFLMNGQLEEARKYF